MKRLTMLAVASFCSAALWAGPAAWYKWHSPDSNVEVCSQTPPGDGWQPVKGPFADGACHKLGTPK